MKSSVAQPLASTVASTSGPAADFDTEKNSRACLKMSTNGSFIDQSCSCGRFAPTGFVTAITGLLTVADVPAAANPASTELLSVISAVPTSDHVLSDPSGDE